MTPIPFRLRPEQRQAMLEHVLSCLPEEACGLVGGLAGDVRQVIPVVNILHSPVRYRMDPRGQVEAMRQIEEAGLDLVAIYHSHPQGPEGPSATDLAEAAYPEALHLIWFPDVGGWAVGAFELDGRDARAVPLIVEGETSTTVRG
ncbi:MAG: M67 family metallopeptidase [Chloroflexota bacterium]